MTTGPSHAFLIGTLHNSDIYTLDVRMWGEIPIIDSDEVGSQVDAAEVDVVLGQDENDAGVEDAEVGTSGGSSVGDEDNMEGQDELVENMVVVEDKGEEDDDDSNHDEEDDEEGDKDNSDYADPQGEKPLENNSQASKVRRISPLCSCTDLSIQGGRGKSISFIF